ncbi:hypothetical protein AMATHDRAFT_57321 [Amanita thiersii Skay4041]|uniref:RNA helicase n=1 Tax=Amanita thiersii Skay4041 TaxID=703135 RepID=A0A2A9NMR4_9AGAR|nr:hypothetical protein AMATHDRAFT_57321 [Amanita thiersii Skay4041]
MNLQLVLPPGPRDYWNELAAEHKAAPQHLQWMYTSDPFAAKREFEERKARSIKASDEPTHSNKRKVIEISTGSKSIPEVKMASDIRELVESAIKRGLSRYPDTEDDVSNLVSDDDVKNISKQLSTLGFSSGQIRLAASFLTGTSSTAANLLSTSTPLEAAIEYLVLHIPECDLPQRFLPSTNSSNPFISSLHSGSDDVEKRWIVEKAIAAGWPAKIVKEYLSDDKFLNNWPLLLVTLGKRLIGEDSDISELSDTSTNPYPIDQAEVEAYDASFVTESELVMPLFSAPIKLHVFISSDSQLAFPRPSFIPVYLSSATTPAYVRLHLLGRLLLATGSDSFLEEGEGFCLAAMRTLEEEWAKIETDGTPDLSSVMQYLIPQRNYTPNEIESTSDLFLNFGSKKKREHPRFYDKRSNAQIRAEYLDVCRQEKYTALLFAREKLPAFQYKDVFLEMLNCHRVVVVVGDTGCGKTTQLPQFILDSLILSNRGSEASIVVTQPRRLAAIAVASRVSAERLDDGSVGYSIRDEIRMTEKTKLLFCTTGVILRRMASGNGLQNVSHVVVDEVHERAVDCDILLLGLKELLRVNPNLRVVLMSATMNHEKFAKYFDNAPKLEIPGFLYPITDLYLEDFEHTVSPGSHLSRVENNDDNKDGVQQDNEDVASSKGSRKRRRANRIDYELIAGIVQNIVATAKKSGGILVFLPGVQEIRRCISAVRSKINDTADVFPLHANLTSDEQNRVFKNSSKWKIIVATNVAETSITIDDVIYVIDTGKVKEVHYDPESNLSRLDECWISRAAGRQRRGRAGRTQPGICYKLYTREDESNMEDFSEPEIHRIPLENIVLYIKTVYESQDVKVLLKRAIDPPKDTAMERAWKTLVDLGALDSTGKTTPLGEYIATLPLDVKLAKMLVFGVIFQCLEPILTITACLSSKPLFVSPMDKRDEVNQAKARFLHDGSDLLTNVRAYDECMRLRAQGKSASVINSFCEENFISPSTVQSVTSLRNDFFLYLMDLSFIPQSLEPSSPELNVNSRNSNVVKAVIMGGLWPNVARIRVREGAQKFDQVQSGTIARDVKARDYLMYDMRDGRVFLHPGSVLFNATNWKCDFVTYFSKYQTDKVFLRDATQIPLYALLLLGGQVTINHITGGLNIYSHDSLLKIKAWPRIGILVNQLRRLLDEQLKRCLERCDVLSNVDRYILDEFIRLITHDGMSGNV